MAQILATLFPIFATLFLGIGLTKFGFLSRTFLSELNRFVYFIALPALMINGVANAEEVFSTLAVYIAATIGMVAVALLVARLLKLARWQYGTFVQASFRGNLKDAG